MKPPVLFHGVTATFDPANGHVLYAGASGTGKTQSLNALVRHKAHDARTGLCLLDPEGELAPALMEYVANPAHRLSWRTVHYLKPASTTHAFSLPVLQVADRNPTACHNAAVRTTQVFQQAVTAGAGDYGPRLTKLFYLGCLALALTGRPLVELPDLFARSDAAQHLRQVVGAAFPYGFISDEWGSFDELSLRTYLEYRDPLISRLLPIFGNPILSRVFGPQSPIDIPTVLRKREIVLLDLSGLEHADAVLVGKAFYSLLHHAAMERPPNRGPQMCVIIDEAFDYISPDLARGFDRLRKRNVQLILAIQRFAQLNVGDDDTTNILSAIISGTRTKVFFRLEEPDDCDYAARIIFTGYVPLSEWKPGTERPVVVGHHKELVFNRSTAHHRAEHAATSETRGVAYGTARSYVTSYTEADSEGVSNGEAHASASGTMNADTIGSSSSSFDGMSSSASMDPMTGGLFTPMTITNMGEGMSSGVGLTDSASHATGRSSNESVSNSHATTSAHTSAVTEAYGETESEVHSRATSHMHGSSRGTSESAGESETFVATIAWMPSQTYSLPEQLHRLAGELKQLPLRTCFVKIDNAPPVRARTTDLSPAFRSAYFRKQLLPLYEKRVVAQSPYLIPVAEADALLAACRAATAAPPPEPDFSPEPIPVIDNPDAFAADYWRGREKLKRPTRRPSKTKKRNNLEVIDGGRGDKDREDL